MKGTKEAELFFKWSTYIFLHTQVILVQIAFYNIGNTESVSTMKK